LVQKTQIEEDERKTEKKDRAHAEDMEGEELVGNKKPSPETDEI